MTLQADRIRIAPAFALVTVLAISAGGEYARADIAPNSQPNPYRWDEQWAPQLPDGRTWGSSAGVAIDPQEHIWVAERCGENALGCAGKSIDPIVELDQSGKFLRSFGGGVFVQPHGITLDKEGNVWITDVNMKDRRGNQVFKFSSAGKLLLTLGKAGVAGAGQDSFNQPSGVAIAPNGDILVADGHGGASNARIVKFDKTGKYLNEWGKKGTGRGEFDTPHAVAFDSRRLFVADRANNRIQIFDQNGKFLEEWTQFSRPSGIFIDLNRDVLYVVDSESRSTQGYGYHPGWKRGIRIGSARTGEVTAFIPDPEPKPDGVASSGAEGIAVDASGNVYAFGDHRQTLVAQKKWVKK